MRVSYSRVNTYQICPQRYKLAYVDRIQVPPPPAYPFGACVHEALRFMHDPGRLAPPSQEEVVDCFCQAWGRRQAEVPPREWSEYFAEGVRLLQAYWEAQAHLPRTTAQTERDFTIPFAAGHRLSGRIDRIDLHPEGAVEVVDYKTTRRIPDQPRIDQDLQLAIYHLAAQHLYPGRPARATFYYLVPNLPITARLSEDQLRARQAEILDVIASIEAAAFDPRTGTCDWCDYRPHCVLYRTPDLDPEVQADLAQVVGEYVLLYRELKEKEARLDRLKALLHDCFDQAGIERAEAGGYQVTRHLQRRASYEEQGLRELLEPLGLWPAVLKVDASAVGRLLRGNRLALEARARLHELRSEQVIRILKTQPATAGEDQESPQ